jgi:hypothetical protein
VNISALIKALELELLQPEVRKSKKRLDELIADDFVEIGTSGKEYDKQDVINDLASQDEIKFTVQNFNTIEISPDTILASYEVEKETSGSESIRSNRTSIWKNIDGNWQIVFHQGTDKTK